MKKSIPFFVYVLLFVLLCSIPILCSDTLAYVFTVGMKDHVIVIDPGHGRNDPGKVGIHGEIEKDINLKIAFKLQKRMI